MERIWNPEAKTFMKQHFFFGKKIQIVNTSNNPQENKDQSYNWLLYHTINSDKFDKVSFLYHELQKFCTLVYILYICI